MIKKTDRKVENKLTLEQRIMRLERVVARKNRTRKFNGAGFAGEVVAALKREIGNWYDVNIVKNTGDEIVIGVSNGIDDPYEGINDEYRIEPIYGDRAPHWLVGALDARGEYIGRPEECHSIDNIVDAIMDDIQQQVQDL